MSWLAPLTTLFATIREAIGKIPEADETLRHLRTVQRMRDDAARSDHAARKATYDALHTRSARRKAFYESRAAKHHEDAQTRRESARRLADLVTLNAHARHAEAMPDWMAAPELLTVEVDETPTL